MMDHHTHYLIFFDVLLLVISGLFEKVLGKSVVVLNDDDDVETIWISPF